MELDDFEFRPLTDGLGFDKTTEESQKTSVFRKPPQAKEEPVVEKTQFKLAEKEFEPKNSQPVSRSLKKMLDSLPPSVDFAQDIAREAKIDAPLLPKEQPKIPVYRPKTDHPAPEMPKNFDVTLNDSLSQAFPKEETSKRFFHQTVTPIAKFKEIEASFASAIIDTLFCSLMAAVFMVVLVGITKVDILAMLISNELNAKAMFQIGFLFVGVTLIYFMIARGLFGSTLGDWAFDVQLGTEKERMHIMYPFQVFFRTMIIIFTGIVLVPLVSMGFGKDMAYYFSGLRLYNRQY